MAPVAQVASPADREFPAVRAALGGSAIWAAWLLLADVGPIEALVGLGATTLHPLVVDLAARGARDRLHRLVGWAQIPTAVALLVGLTIGPGLLAACLAAAWLLTTGLTALLGVRRFVRHRGRPIGEVSIDAGLVYLVVGGASAVLHGAGLRPFGFSATIVLLTAAHFHYAGFVLPVLAGLLARRIEHRAFALVPAGVVAGVPLVAVGILGSPTIEVVAAFVVASAAVGVAVGQLVVAWRTRDRVPTVLLAISSLALVHGMTLAVIYATGEYRGLPWPSIPEMAWLHGTVNGLGFALLGVWAWTLLERRRAGALEASE